MKKIGLAILGVAFAAIAVASVDGSGCVTRQRVVVQQAYVAPYVAPAYVAPVVAAVFAPVYVPQYSVGYAPDLEKERQFIEMKLRLEQLEKRISEPPLLPAKGAAQVNHPAIAVMTRSCAKCHDEMAAKTMGKGFVLFKQGSITDLTPDQILDVLDHTSSGFMPKGAKELTGEEVGHLLDYFAKQRKKK